MEPIDIREQNDPARDASRPYGQASADANALRSLKNIGGGTPTLATPDAQDRNKRGAQPVALPQLVNPGTVVPNGGRPDSQLDASGTLMGGMGQKYPFMASNELSQKALLSFPPSVQQAFANRKIDRPSTMPDALYGHPATSGGYYAPDTGQIALARGNAQAYGDPNVDVGGAQHEILHAISYEGQFFSQDRQAGYPALKSAFKAAEPTLEANPSTTRAVIDAETALSNGDPDHLFTALGDLYIKGALLPPALRQYFDHLQTYAPVPAEAAPIEPSPAAGAPTEGITPTARTNYTKTMQSNFPSSTLTQPDGFTAPANYQYPDKGTTGPDLAAWAATNPFMQSVRDAMAHVGETAIPRETAWWGLFEQLTGRQLKIGDIGALFAPPSGPEGFDNPLYALGPEGNFAGNVVEALSPAAKIVANQLRGGAETLAAGQAPRFLTEAAGEGRPDLGLGGPSQIEGGLTARIGGKGSLGVPEEGAGPMGAQNVARKALAQETATRTGVGPTAERQGTITSAEGQPILANTLTRSLQTAAGQEGVPLSQHPIFADYGAKGSKGPVVARAHGGDIGTATRAVMAGDMDAMSLLGPELTQQLIQNKIASVIRATGAPEDVIRRGLSLMVNERGAAADAIAPAEVVNIGASTRLAPQVVEAVQKSAKSVPGATAESLAKTPDLRGALDGALSQSGVPITDVNRTALAQTVMNRPAPIPPNATITTAGRAGGAQPSDYQKLVDVAKAAGATDKEIAELTGTSGAATRQRVAQVQEQMRPPAERAPSEPLPAVEGSGGPPQNGSKGTLFADAELQRTIARKFTPKTALDVATQAMYNSIVFPTTNLLHSFGSTASALAQFPEKVLLSGVDKALHGAGVTTSRNFALDASVAGLNAQLHAYGNSIAHELPDTILRGTNSLVDVDVPAEAATALMHGEYGSNLGLRALGVAGRVAGMGSYPLRIIAAIDNATIRGLTASNLIERGYIEGINQGLKGPELHAFAADYFSNAGAAALDEAATAARTQINRQAAGQIGASILRAKGATGPIGTVLLPFFNTKLNILKAAATWSPLGFARLIPREIPVLGFFGKNTVTEAARVQALTRAAAGTLLIYPIWQQVLSDNITGDGPTDPRQKSIWAGDPSNPSHVERAIRLPMGWVTYGKVPVLGDYLAAIADTAQAVRDSNDPDVSGAQAGALGLVQYFAKEEQGLAAAADTVSAIWQSITKPNDAQAQAAAAQQLSNRGFELTPWSGAMRAYSTVTESNYRTAPKGTRGLAGRTGADYAAQVPFLNQDYPQGAPRVPGVTGGAGALLPVHVSGQSAGPVVGTAAGLPPVASQESERLAAAVPSFTPLALPQNKIGLGTPQEIPLSGSEYLDYARYVGQEREKAINALLLTRDYQGAAPAIQARMYASAISEANKDGEAQYLAQGVLKSTEPALAQQEAVLGFHVLTTERDKAYWVALLDRSGNLTPELVKAIETSQTPPLPGQKAPTTVAEYRAAAPLIHEYMQHAPFGSDSKPTGTPVDWHAVVVAHTAANTRANELERSGTTKALAESRAEKEILSTLTPVQRNLYLNGSALENIARSRLVAKHPELAKFVDNVDAKHSQETDAEYTNFPVGRP